jgi:hypothetical protein
MYLQRTIISYRSPISVEAKLETAKTSPAVFLFSLSNDLNDPSASSDDVVREAIEARLADE